MAKEKGFWNRVGNVLSGLGLFAAYTATGVATGVAAGNAAHRLTRGPRITAEPSARTRGAVVSRRSTKPTF